MPMTQAKETRQGQAAEGSGPLAWEWAGPLGILGTVVLGVLGVLGLAVPRAATVKRTHLGEEGPGLCRWGPL